MKPVTAQISELSEPIWAVFAPDGCFACRITYRQAEDVRALQKDGSQTIVTAAVAAKIGRHNHPAG